MPYLTDLADACRKSGLKVVEVDGWKSRGHRAMSGVRTIACHHTATSARASGDYPSLGIVRAGRSDLPGPLAQLGLGRSGTVYVIAAGVAYHAGATRTSSEGNDYAIGIEAEHDGVSPWPLTIYDAYARLCAALCDHYGPAEDDVKGHKEIAVPRGRKIDPNFDMDAFRARVAIADQEDFDMDKKEAREMMESVVRETVPGIVKEQLDKQRVSDLKRTDDQVLKEIHQTLRRVEGKLNGA